MEQPQIDAAGFAIRAHAAIAENDDLRARLAAAERDRDEAKAELSVWRSVFPDIAPDSVLPDRSLLDATIAAQSAALAKAREALEAIRSINVGFWSEGHSRALDIASAAIYALGKGSPT
jgi:hypothetical protein